jgi:hypothetical protein
MASLPNDDDLTLEELHKILSGERLGQVFDQLEPRARRLSKQPSAVAFGILFGALFLILGVVLGYFAWLVYGFPWTLVALCNLALTAAGIALGNIIALGRKGIAFERKARSVEAFLRPLMPILIQLRKDPATRDVGRQLADNITAQIDEELPTTNNNLPVPARRRRP